MICGINPSGQYNLYDQNNGYSSGQGMSGCAHTLEQKRIANGTSNGERQVGAAGILSSSSAYAQSLKNSRLQTKETSNEIKKLRYNFKDISSQIMRSKTSLSAKQVVSKARREVLRLKRAKASGQYEGDEVDAALEHAKSMERVAKKKAAHLQQEEMIHVTDKPGTNSIAEELKEHPEKLGDKEDVLDELTTHSPENGGGAGDSGSGKGDGTDSIKAAENMTAELRMQMEAMQEMAHEQMEAMSEEMAAETAEKMDEFMSEMSEQMSAMMDQMNEALEDMDLMEQLTAPPREMNEADFKMYVTKHRTDEMKEIAEADKEYLKVIFDKYNKMKHAATAGAAAVSGSSSPVSSVTYSPKEIFKNFDQISTDNTRINGVGLSDSGSAVSGSFGGGSFGFSGVSVGGFDISV